MAEVDGVIHLLNVVQHPIPSLPSGTKEGVIFRNNFFIPQAMDPPYLVSSANQGVVVTDKGPYPGVLGAGVRDFNPEVVYDIYRDIVVKAHRVCGQLGFGNSLPLTPVAFKVAVSHLIEYLPDDGEELEFEFLVPPGADFEVASFGQRDVIETEWMPRRHAVVVPVSRAFLGDLHVMGGRYVAAVVHNVSRSIAVLRDEQLASNIPIEDGS